MNLQRAMATGSAWMIAGRWILRSIGLVSTIVLARLLTPADFGLVAMAMLVIGALQVLAETGQRQAIIRLKEPSRAHYDSAWTMGILIGVGVAVLLAIAGPVAADQFEEPRLTWIIWLLALRPLIQGFENIGLVDLQRSLNFRTDLAIMLWGKVSGFVVTLSLALYFRNYWALIAGTLVQACIGVALSFVFSSFRPRWSLGMVGELWSFSMWSQVTNMAGYFNARADHAVIAGALDADAVGTYTVAMELGTLPTEELVAPPVRALFAVYSRVAEEREVLRAHYLTALSFIAVVASSTSVGVALVASDAVDVILGERWHLAAPLIPWLALTAGIFGVIRSMNTVLLAAGYARANALRALLFLFLLFPSVLVGVQWKGAEGAAIARFVATLAFLPIMLMMVARLLQVRVTAMLDVMWRPLLAAAGMAAAVLTAHPSLPEIPVIRLGLDAAIGSAVYGGLLFITWIISGRRPGAEALFLSALHRKFTRSAG